jgi:GGDEF domain-containing protein
MEGRVPGAEHNRAYLQSRIREETARHARHGHPFAVLVFEALPGDGTPIRHRLEQMADALSARLRPSDVIGRAFDDTIVVILIETDAVGAHDALFRLRNMLAASGAGASWHIESYAYPDDSDTITALPLMTAA